jgi:hypothetical protein
MSHGTAAAPGCVDNARPISHRDVLLIAVPIMLSNATTPLIGPHYWGSEVRPFP